MALRFITNTIFRDASKLSASGFTTNGGSVDNLRSGARYLGWDWSRSGADEVIYQRNDDYTLVADTFVIAGGADQLTEATGYNIDYLDESTGWTTITPNETASSTWDASTDSSAIIGPDSDDIVLTFDKISDASAYRWTFAGGSPSVTDGSFQKLWFSESMEFGSEHSVISVTMERTRATVQRGQSPYVIDLNAQIIIGHATRADINSFKQQWKIDEEPFFLYDSDAQYIPEKLWHVVLTSFNAQPVTDNVYSVTLGISRLKGYSLYF